jgi:adenylate cyclase
MTIRLADLQSCFEGVIPSIISTAAADGMPNISYLSHVAMVDDSHIALSNQFFAKTSANIRANPLVTLMLVDGNDGTQYVLDIRFERSVDDGPLFERIALQLRATSAQIGMAGIMRLKSADIFEVLSVRRVPSNAELEGEAGGRRPANLAAVGRVSESISKEIEAGGIIDALLDGLHRELGCESAVVLLHDADCGVLTTVGSIGHEAAGLGSEVQNKDNLIASAAAHGRSIKISDLSRARRFGEAILSESRPDENAGRSIAFPHLSDAMSQLAVPMIAQGRVRGVIFVESRERMAFRDDDVAAVELLASQTAAAIALSERDADEVSTAGASMPLQLAQGVTIQVIHHAFDDSIFIGNDYVIKGVAGRLLAFLIDRYLKEGRRDFTNREIRLSESLRLPDLKDNLETRLLLLRRRLDSKPFPIRLIHAGRGKITLDMDGMPTIRTVE